MLPIWSEKAPLSFLWFQQGWLQKKILPSQMPFDVTSQGLVASGHCAWPSTITIAFIPYDKPSTEIIILLLQLTRGSELTGVSSWLAAGWTGAQGPLGYAALPG